MKNPFQESADSDQLVDFHILAMLAFIVNRLDWRLLDVTSVKPPSDKVIHQATQVRAEKGTENGHRPPWERRQINDLECLGICFLESRTGRQDDAGSDVRDAGEITRRQSLED